MIHRKLVFLRDSPSLIQVDEAVAVLCAHGLTPVRSLAEGEAAEVVAIVTGLGKFPATDAAGYPNLRTVAQFGAGTDNIDVQGLWQSRRIAVTCTPNLSNRHVAEWALALLILTLRAAPRDASGLRAEPFSWRDVPRGLGLSEAVVGVIGCGNIGLEAAALVAPLAAKVLLWNRSAKTIRLPQVDPDRCEVVADLNELAERADAVTVHLALNAGTRGLLGEAFFARGRGLALVNTSRGNIVDEAALLVALENGTVKSAGIDVWSTEGAGTTDIVQALRRHPGVLPSSHIGAFTQGVQRLYAVQVARNIAAIVEGREAEIAPYIADPLG